MSTSTVIIMCSVVLVMGDSPEKNVIRFDSVSNLI